MYKFSEEETYKKEKNVTEEDCKCDHTERQKKYTLSKEYQDVKTCLLLLEEGWKGIQVHTYTTTIHTYIHHNNTYNTYNTIYTLIIFNREE